MKSDRIVEINLRMEEIRRGKKGAVEALHCLMGDRLFLAAYRYLKVAADADDLVQDFWMRIHTICARLRFTGNGEAYLIKVIENMAKSRCRRADRREIPFEPEAFEECGSYDPTETTIRQTELKQSFVRAAREMNDAEREVFWLMVYRERSVREIARDTGRTKAQAERLCRKVKEILTLRLKADGWAVEEEPEQPPEPVSNQILSKTIVNNTDQDKTAPVVPALYK